MIHFTRAKDTSWLSLSSIFFIQLFADHFSSESEWNADSRINEIGNIQSGTNLLQIAAFRNRLNIVHELIRLKVRWD